jgi:hypothetical protein
MDTAPIVTDGLTATEVIDAVRNARVVEQSAAIQQLQLAVQWALLHPCTGEHAEQPSPRALTLFECGCALAGPGTPLVDEFAPASLAAALAIPRETATQLIGEGLELLYRLPRLWALVLQGQVPVWRARMIARETTDLGPEAVAFADRLISAVPSKTNLVNATRLVNEARLYFDPDRAVAEEEAELAKRGVWLRHRGNPATTEVLMTLQTFDAHLFDQTVGRLAADLKTLGDPDHVDARRARAVGILADPQHALDLLSGREDAGPTPGHAAGAMNLYLHLTPDDLAPADLDPADLDPAGVAGAVSIEKLGAATTRLLEDWLARCTATGAKITLRPVLDLTATTTGTTTGTTTSPATRAVDRHDPPPAMRELGVLRDAHCVFPGCRRDSRACRRPPPTAVPAEGPVSCARSTARRPTTAAAEAAPAARARGRDASRAVWSRRKAFMTAPRARPVGELGRRRRAEGPRNRRSSVPAMTPPPASPRAGWYPDPEHDDQERYWDGTAWTDHRQPAAGNAASGGMDTTAVMPAVASAPVATPPSTATTTGTTTTTSTTSPRQGQNGWVPALVGLLVGLIVGGVAAAVVVGNNDNSSAPTTSPETGAPASTVTATPSP